MQPARLRWTAAADADVEQLWLHIATQSSAAIADQFVRRIYRALDLVADNPGIRRVRSNLAGAPRSFAVRPYVIVYSPLDGGGALLWRVIHGARRLEDLVRAPPE